MFCLINAQWFVLSNKYTTYTLYVLCIQLSSSSLNHGNLRSNTMSLTPFSVWCNSWELESVAQNAFFFCIFFSPFSKPKLFYGFILSRQSLNWNPTHSKLFRASPSVSSVQIPPTPVLEILAHCSKLPPIVIIIIIPLLPNFAGGGTARIKRHFSRWWCQIRGKMHVSHQRCATYTSRSQ